MRRKLDAQDPYDVTSFLYVLAIAAGLGVWVLGVCFRLIQSFVDQVYKKMGFKGWYLDRKADAMDRSRLYQAMHSLINSPEILAALTTVTITDDDDDDDDDGDDYDDDSYKHKKQR